MYKSIETQVIDKLEDYLLSEWVFDHVLNEMGGKFPNLSTEIEELPGITQEAKNIWYSRLFFSELGCHDSIFDYLINFAWPAVDISATLNSLKKIGAEELYIRLHDGIYLSRFEDGQFWDDEQKGDLDKVIDIIRYSSFDEIDTEMNSLSHNLDEIMVSYIRENKNSF